MLSFTRQHITPFVMSTRPCASGSSRFAFTLSRRIQFANVRSLAILSRYTTLIQILSLCLLNLDIGNQRRYIKAMEDYFYSLISQVDLSSSAKQPDIETHITLRSESIGVKLCLAFTELVTPKVTTTTPATDRGETLLIKYACDAGSSTPSIFLMKSSNTPLSEKSRF